MKKEFIIIICLFSLFAVPINGQTLEEEVLKLFPDNKKTEQYLGPLSKAFGAMLGSSTYFSAKANTFPHFDVGINYIMVPIAKSEMVFGSGSTRSATVFGSSKSDSSNSRGLNINTFALPVLQLNFGIGDNTNILIRYSEWKNKKLGKIKVYGAGVKYELEDLFSISPIPFNIGVLAIYQKYKIDDYLEGAIFGMNIVGSKEISVLPLEIYGGAGYINNITNVNNPSDKGEASLSVPGLEEIRYQLGITYSVFIFNLNAEYNFGDYKSINLGLRIIL